MKFKVCGLKESANMLDVSELKPDYIGLIFWSKSKRFVKDSTPELPNEIKKTGVFVDENVLRQIREETDKVCKFTNCQKVAYEVLRYLGYKVSLQKDKILIEGSEIIQDVAFEGIPDDVESSLEALRLILVKKKFDETLVENVRKLILLRLHSVGYRKAKVKVSILKRPDGYAVKFRVIPGPLFFIQTIKIKVSTKFKSKVEKTFRELVGKAVNTSEIKEKIEELEDYFLKQGYYNVSIDYKINDKTPSTTLVVSIDLGKLYVVKFKGNKSFSQKKLRKLLTFASSKSLDEFEIERSKKNIEIFYKNNGFPFVKVSFEFTEEQNISILTFLIREGKKVVIRKVAVSPTLKGKDISFLNSAKGVFSLKKVEKVKVKLKKIFEREGFRDVKVSYYLDGSTLVLKVFKGKKYKITGFSIIGARISFLEQKLPIPYSKEFVKELKEKILRYYLKKGYIDATVKIKEKISEAQEIANVYLYIYVTPGIQYKFCYVIVVGLKRTKLSLVRKLIVIKPSKLYSREDVVKQYSILSRTQLFSRVNVESFKTDGCINEIIRLEEASKLRVKGFVGFGTDTGFTTNGFISSTSPLGWGMRYTLLGNYRQKEGYDAVFRITKVAFPTKDYSVSYTIIRKEQLFESFTVDRIIHNFSINRQRGKKLFQALGFEVGNEKVFDTSINTQNSFIKRSMYVSQTYDKRNSKSNPSKGYMVYLKLAVSGGFLGGDTDYYLVESKSLFLMPLREKLVFAFRVAGGVIDPIADSPIPIQDRFYLGGAESIRGYKYGTVSPQDENGNFIGGNCFGFFSFELRYNLKKSLQLALFYDTGNVFEEPKEFNLRFSEWYSSVGIGFRYITPVGPLRFDYGYKLKRVEGQGPGRFHISFGFPF
ncbi:MAG: BamA/TamA family outer membrane protein [Desulfurobacteriaceae bacterium]